MPKVAGSFIGLLGGQPHSRPSDARDKRADSPPILTVLIAIT
jgi:hypothetical protein